MYEKNNFLVGNGNTFEFDGEGQCVIEPGTLSLHVALVIAYVKAVSVPSDFLLFGVSVGVGEDLHSLVVE